MVQADHNSQLVKQEVVMKNIFIRDPKTGQQHLMAQTSQAGGQQYLVQKHGFSTDVVSNQDGGQGKKREETSVANQVEEPAGHSTHDVTLLHNDGNTLSWANRMEEVKSKAVEEINPAKLNEKLLVKVKRLDNEAELDVLDRALQDGINHPDERKQSELKETEKDVENTNWERITFQENLTRWEQQMKGWLM